MSRATARVWWHRLRLHHTGHAQCRRCVVCVTCERSLRTCPSALAGSDTEYREGQP